MLNGLSTLAKVQSSRVYTTPMANIAELRARIKHAFEELPQAIVHRVIDSYEHRLRIEVNGRCAEQEYNN